MCVWDTFRQLEVLSLSWYLSPCQTFNKRNEWIYTVLCTKVHRLQSTEYKVYKGSPKYKRTELMFRPAEVLLDGEGGDSIEIIFVQLPRDPWQASIRLLSQCLNFFCYLGNRQRVKKFDYLKVSPTENNKPLAGEGWSSGQMGHWNGTIAQASPASQAPLLLPLLSPSLPPQTLVTSTPLAAVPYRQALVVSSHLVRVLGESSLWCAVTRQLLIFFQEV